MPTHYSDHTDISKALIYNSILYPDVNTNLATYGRLYTWFSAVGTGEGSSTSPVADAHGFVQGICPEGWHIPTLLERTALDAIPAEDLRATTLWTIPNGNTNSTGFTALPAGKFNSTANRFEGLGTETGWWTVVPCENSTSDALCSSSFQIVYYCDTPQLVTNNANDALSVRCVKNHEQ